MISKTPWAGDVCGDPVQVWSGSRFLWSLGALLLVKRQERGAHSPQLQWISDEEGERSSLESVLVSGYVRKSALSAWRTSGLISADGTHIHNNLNMLSSSISAWSLNIFSFICVIVI